MVRAVLVEGLLFLAPFIAFSVLLVLRRRRILAIESWSSHALWLTVAGMLLVLGSLLYKGLVADRPMSGFEPTHMEDGRLVPGRFR